MSHRPQRFPPPLEAQFQAARAVALAEINVTTYPLVAVLVMLFGLWDWFVDPVNWRTAVVIRCIGALFVIASGVIQRVSARPDWAPAIARLRFTAGTLAVAGALAVLEQGYIVGLAGLVAMLLSGPYIARDRRDLLVLYAGPLAMIGLIMFAAGLDRFAVINSAVFLALSVGTGLLLAQVFELSNRRAFALEQQLTREARTDALTGLRNRRALEEVAAAELKRSVRTASPLALILCDVDHFKRINDRHGHDVGDRVIRAVADQLQTVVRASDALGRWGGEEFLVILPDTDETEALILAERLRAAVAAAPMPTGTDAPVTISMGVAGPTADAGAETTHWNRILKAADDALYRAKAAGRNRVMPATRNDSAG